MLNEFSRSQLLLGKRSIQRLKECSVAVFGIGGVGGYTVEALVRTGIGRMLLIDNDTVSLTNINRQIIADHRTIGMQKVDVMKERARAINPEVQLNATPYFFCRKHHRIF